MNPFSYYYFSNHLHLIALEDSISLSLINGQILYSVFAKVLSSTGVLIVPLIKDLVVP